VRNKVGLMFASKLAGELAGLTMELESQTHLEQTLMLSQDNLLDIMPNGVVVINGSGDIIRVNDAAINLLGNNLVGSAWRDVIEQSFAPREDDGHEISLKDGRRVNISISSLQLIPGEMIVLTDLTTTRNYQQAQSRQQRLAEMGEMTAHLAHQIRTPLASAMIYADHLSKDSLSLDKRLKFIEKIKACHSNIEQQIKDLLFFAKGGKTILIQQSTNVFIESLADYCHALSDKFDVRISLNNDFPENEFICHSESLHGALLNLINNAIDADATEIELRIKLDESSMLQFTIKDNGCGMSEEVKTKIMTPFYTTKAKGTGLGLAVVQAVAEVHGGRVEISSETGQGSCFSLTIPWIKEPLREEL
jgi:two-component system sensor histidine kinase FlrB